MNSQLEVWRDVSLFSESLGGTTVPYERILQLITKDRWIVWGLDQMGANARFYNGGEDCRLEVMLSQEKLNGLYMIYSDNGELERVSMSLMAFLYLTRGEESIEIAHSLLDSNQDVLMSVEPLLGRVVVSWVDKNGNLHPVVNGYVGEVEKKAVLELKLPGKHRLRMEIEMGGDEVRMSLGNWQIGMDRWVDARAIEDIKSPGMASDYLFGEVITISELLPGDGGFAGELDG